MMSVLSQKLLSRSARTRILDELEQNVLGQLTSDPAMPAFLRNFVGALVGIFWADFAQEVEFHEVDADDSTENYGDAVEIAALLRGTLQVLVVEARHLVPAHGIGTNPYVRGVVGHEVRRSHTSWSTLRPAWNCLMEFPIVSFSGALELEVMSQAPLFGGDSRLGHVTLPLRDIIVSPSRGRAASQMVYRFEQLQGVDSGELVLVVDYRDAGNDNQSTPLASPRRCCGSIQRVVCRWCAQFRAFFLYHYWPCDKSLFQMYLREPIDIALLLVSLSPSVLVRAVFYTVLLICLCVPWPPDEHQINHFILAFKGAAVFTDGVGRILSGILVYYSCIRANNCSEGNSPGSTMSALTVLGDVYQEALLGFVCFWVLPRTIPYRLRAVHHSAPSPTAQDSEGADSNADLQDGTDRSGGDDHQGDEEAGTQRGGRMSSLLRYNMLSLLASLTIFVLLTFLDTIRAWQTGSWATLSRYRVPENFFWSRCVFGLSMFPFLFLLHPQINKLLTHSTPTGYTRLGTLRRFKLPKRPREVQGDGMNQREEASNLSAGAVDCSVTSATAKAVDSAGRPVDPVADLTRVIRRVPGGGVALCVGHFTWRATSLAARTMGSAISVEIRVASAAVSLGLRVVDACVSSTCSVMRCVPGSRLPFRAGAATLHAARRTGSAGLALSCDFVRHLPGGLAALDVLDQVFYAVGFLAATAESPGLADEVSAPPLIQVGSQKAEELKLEAAGRLAELLTSAEQNIEREATEAIERVRPEIEKISLALLNQRRSVQDKISRACCGYVTLTKSLQALARDGSLRAYSAVRTLVEVARREYADLQAQRSDRRPGWMPVVEAYSRVVVSSVCEAFFELRPGGSRSMLLSTVPDDASISSPRWRHTEAKRRKGTPTDSPSTNSSARIRSASPMSSVGASSAIASGRKTRRVQFSPSAFRGGAASPPSRSKPESVRKTPSSELKRQ